MLFSYEHERIGRFSNLHYCTFKLNNQSITSPHNEPQRSPGFAQKQPGEVLCEKGVLKNFANFIEEKLYWNLFLITLEVLRPVTLLKRYSYTDAFT